MEDANESVKDMTSGNFGQVLQSNTSYDNYHKTSREEEKTQAMDTSSLSAVFNNETERCSPYSNNVSNEYYNEGVNLGQENQSDLGYYNPYQYEAQQSYAHNFYDNHYTNATHSYHNP